MYRNPNPRAGDVLLNDYLKKNKETQKAFSRRSGIPYQKLNQIIHGRQDISKEIATKLACALNTTAEYWLDLQKAYNRGKELVFQQNLCEDTDCNYVLEEMRERLQVLETVLESVIQHWHACKNPMELHEFLGLTEEEYEKHVVGGTIR